METLVLSDSVQLDVYTDEEGYDIGYFLRTSLALGSTKRKYQPFFHPGYFWPLVCDVGM